MSGALPNLIVIGAMKCGTSSLHEYLARHPDVGMSNPKEVNFFSGECSNRSLDWYMALFDPTKKVRGESSQNYSKGHHPLYEGAPAAIHKLIPDVKMIYLVRDPIERYLSHIVESYYGDPEEDRRWNESNDHYVRTGLYFAQLGYFLQYFPLEQILVIDTEELRSNRLATMNEIFRFLGLCEFDDPEAFNFVVNDHASNTVPFWMTTNPVYRAARKVAPGTVERLARTPLVKNKLFPDGRKKALSAQERAALADRFRDDVAQLRKLTGKPFASWSV
jgi:Sulfotransferase domain